MMSEAMVLREVQEARDAFSNTLLPARSYSAMKKGLAIMALHCPADLRGMVEGTLEEACIREAMEALR